MPSVFNAKVHTDLLHLDHEFELFPQAEDGSPLQFIWSDYNECCAYFHEKTKGDSDVAKLREQKLAEISHLKNIPVWIKKGHKLYTTHLYDIYQSHLQQKTIFDYDVAAPLDISFISPSGPFKKMAISDCLNIQSYQDFVSLSLLDNKLPSREFRLRLQSRLLLESGSDFEHTFLGNLCQLTAKGLLFKVKSGDFFNKIKGTSQLRLLMNTQIFESTKDHVTWTQVKNTAKNWPAHPLYTQNKNDAFILDPKELQLAHRFDYGRTSEVYFFVTFKHLSSSHTLMVKRIEKFLVEIKSCIKNSMTKKSA
jgi:hypothetical protein